MNFKPFQFSKNKYRVLLVSTQRALMGFDLYARIPNLGLNSLAANIDKNLFDVRVVDLVCVGKKAVDYLKNIVDYYQPDVIGISAMSFQYATALELAKFIRSYNREIKILLGGYHASLTYEEILNGEGKEYFDILMCGESEFAFAELLKYFVAQNKIENVPNIAYWNGERIIVNERAKLLDVNKINLPDRASRIIKKGFYIFGYPADAVETSRGCVFDCSFCCITQMYGKSFRKFEVSRVIEDIKNAKSNGAKAIVFVDDNITLDGKRFTQICDEIIKEKLNNIKYAVQASINGLKNTPQLIEKMAESGVKWVFLGIEATSDEALNFLHKDNQFKSNEISGVVKKLKDNGMVVFGGIIIGNPNDSEKSIWTTFEFVKKLRLHVAGFVLLTPFPKTRVREELIEMGLLTNYYDYSKYNFYHANIKTKYLSSDGLFNIRNKLDSKYLLYSNAIFRLISKHPLFFFRLITRLLFTKPKKILGYFSGKF
ncbi:MAG: B12-binding domain-containing radical SAM protein [Ignavibacteriales bacterium]|nr:B12-binding domain-containing radical SAM protein [Ignavibacteriales bacterium]